MPRPASEVVVRIAREDEYAAIGALTVAGYQADGYLTRANGSYDDGYAGWLADAAARGRHDTLLVATVDDRLVGTVTWCPHGSASAQIAQRPDQGEFRTLSVDPVARGRGVARALVRECLTRARAEGLTEVLLCSLDEMAPAHRLYTSMGFVRRPELDWSPAPGTNLLSFSIDMAGEGRRGDGR
ncbi:GNAT family N-acetyltransferase [Aeromicrobium wangtongii]|uniref:GNAT family N-acetyltransferase n=1 Tax=Aeromicrobium wangtongii TaxID=2969247 RepID=UPI002016CBC3|nr:GNAT family N-acetyltransferase [Aeromicrobium wangtongii]MCL3820076.1 GNAT family N-acetyltransferase [Aeromicrobium wangtongii]